ncbi:MAG: cyclodeaminase/cyclohydrolase family protein [Candidatus Brocadiia bacterium]
MYRDESIEHYLDDAAAKRPTPGGGSISALAAALAASMSEMTANFTVGRKKDEAAEARIRELLDDVGDCRAALLELVDRDVAAYGAVDDAFGMPKESDEQKAARRKALDEAMRGAMESPLEVMRQAARVGRIAAELTETGNRNLITDAGVSAVLAEAACSAARLNVEINLKFLKAPDLARETRAEMDELCETARECREKAVEKTYAYLKG